MQIDNILKLKKLVEDRNSSVSAYKSKDIRISFNSTSELVLSGNYVSKLYDKHVKAAILELEDVIIKRAVELEELEYSEIERLAKIESANLLAGQKII